MRTHEEAAAAAAAEEEEEEEEEDFGCLATFWFGVHCSS